MPAFWGCLKKKTRKGEKGIEAKKLAVIGLPVFYAHFTFFAFLDNHSYLNLSAAATAASRAAASPPVTALTATGAGGGRSYLLQ